MRNPNIELNALSVRKLHSTAYRTVLSFAVLCVISISVTVVFGDGGATYYVRAGATGNASGGDWTNAFTDLPAALKRGATYYVAAGTYKTHTFNDKSSGSTPITVKGATAADHGTATGWSGAYAVGPDTGKQAVWNTMTGGVIWRADTAYYTFDGNTPGGCDPTHLCGFKLDIRGAIDAGLCVPNNCYGLYLNGAGTPTNITLRYADVPGAGQTTTTTKQSFAVYGNKIAGTIGPITLQHNWLHDFAIGGGVLSRHWSGENLAEYNYIEKNGPSGNQHGNAWSDAGSRFIVRYNQFWDIFGTGFITSLGACQPGVCEDDGWEIYGNVFGITDDNPNQPPQSPGPGTAISCINGNICNGWKIYNNTFYNFRLDWGYINSGRIDNEGPGDGWIVENNLWWCAANCSSAKNVLTTGGTPGRSDYNAYAPGVAHLAEAHAITAKVNPFVDSSTRNLRLAVPTLPGLLLSAPHNIDPNGILRGADGIWDRGAYELGDFKSPTHLRIVGK